MCLEREKVYARSHSDAPRHESFDALKALHATIRWSIPEDWQVFGEWMWARHSIAYERLPAYLLVFGVRESVQNRWLSWDDTTAWCATMSLSHVPLLWRGTIHSAQELEKLTISLTTKPSLGEVQEGLVVRIADAFDNQLFDQSVGKWVRADHVQTSVHWTAQKIERNHLLV